MSMTNECGDRSGWVWHWILIMKPQDLKNYLVSPNQLTRMRMIVHQTQPTRKLNHKWMFSSGDCVYDEHVLDLGRSTNWCMWSWSTHMWPDVHMNECSAKFTKKLTTWYACLLWYSQYLIVAKYRVAPKISRIAWIFCFMDANTMQLFTEMW